MQPLPPAIFSELSITKYIVLLVLVALHFKFNDLVEFNILQSS